ncbi:MAG TPA: M28 family metallopeptidase [Rhodothermales bacterium]|nr:M28 family metallopeptidase [Rhodothermales bacterium]
MSLRLAATCLVLGALTVRPVLGQRAGSELARTYQHVSKQLIQTALADSATYERLAYLTDTFGPRFSGTPSLERAIDWVVEEMKRDGLENVHTEPVMVPHWVRGRETLNMLEPQQHGMSVLGLGGTVATPPGGITADVFVVGSFDELERKKDQAKAKIVLFNVPFTSYGETVKYRVNGAVEAAKAGAVASLVRSVGPVSLYTPHAGNMHYRDGTPPIPHAAVTIEDAMMMQRMQDRGQRIRLRLVLEDQTLPDAPSRNVVAEITGSEHPEEVVVMGGHIDSWDVGRGAMDDGAGCLVAWQALRIMKKLGLRPRRTIRVVLWTNEENGGRGGEAYRDAHRSELADVIAAIESDEGTFQPQGFGLAGSQEAFRLVQEIGTLLRPIGAGQVVEGRGAADIEPLMNAGVPGLNLVAHGGKYFWYHHTNADTMDKLDPGELAACTAAMAVMSYVLADMPERLPRATPAASQ